MQVDSVLTVTTLFFFGLISPGPNLLVVVQTTLSFGRVAGIVTGLGAETGDAVYASLGLFGVSRMTALGGYWMTLIELLGGMYLAWLGTRMLTRHVEVKAVGSTTMLASKIGHSHFWRGLVTDLANPKTVVFFASIFAVTVTPETSRTIRAAMLLGIVTTSLAWRFLLSVVFSTDLIRSVYERTERVFERVFGGGLCVFGLVLLGRALTPGVY